MKKIISLLMLSLICIACGGSGGGNEDGNEAPINNNIVLMNPEYNPALPVRGVGFFPLLSNKITQPGPNGIIPLDAIIEILRESSNPGVSFPMQTFGNETQNYKKLIDSLLEVGKAPTVTIYVICGPCRKGRGTGEWEYFYPNLDIEDLQHAIVNDEAVRNSYVNLLNTVQTLIIMYPNLNYIVIPELEDNQTDKSFKAMLDLTKMVFDSFPNVKIRRNPLEKYGKSNFGLTIERHGTDIGTLRSLNPESSLNFDGSDFNFPDEHYEGDPSFDDIKNLIIEARITNKEIYLWRPEWQGRFKNLGGASVHPDNRTYLVDHVEELKQLMILP